MAINSGDDWGTIRDQLNAIAEAASNFISFDTVQQLLASTASTFGGAGAIIEAGGFRYTEADAVASDYDVQNAAGVKFYVNRNEDGNYPVEALHAWGDAVAGQNAVISHANRVGDATVGVSPLAYVYTSPDYDLRGGGVAALEVSSVKFYGGNARLRLRDGAAFVLGSPGALADNVSVQGFTPDCSDVPVRRPKPIAYANKTNPVRINCPDHGYATGDKVRLFDVGGMIEINDIPFTVTVVNSTYFDLDGVDGTGYTTYTSGGEVRPETDAALVSVVNAARVSVSGVLPKRLTHIVKADPPAGCGVSTISINDCRINGHESYDWVALHTRNAAFGTGLFIDGVTGYPTAVPADPTILPKTVTGATQANPVVITCAGHGFSTGDNIRLSAIGGMTEISGRDFTITVIDANSLSLDGEDGTGHTAYTSGGWATELHWSQDFDTGFVFINGKWDTARVRGGPIMHYAWLWRLRSSGVISFIWEDNARFDYGGKGRMQVALDGYSITHVQANGGWHFALDGDFVEITKPNAAAAYITDFIVRGMEIGLIGDSFVNDPLNRIINLDITDNSFDAVGRARRGTSYLINPGLNSRSRINGNRSPLPDDRYGVGAAAMLSADIGISLNASLRYDVSHNEIRTLSTAYDLPKATSGNPRDRIIRGNKRADGALPEYLATVVATAPASTATATNYTGLTQNINLRGGTMTNVSKNGTVIMSGLAAYRFDVKPGESWSVNYSVAPTLVIDYVD